jgi:GxxExxY protein
MRKLLENLLLKITNELGYGFREVIYQNALAVELRNLNHKVELEANKSVIYCGHDVGTVHLDIIIDDKIILEIKAIQKLTNKEIIQVKNYMRVTGISEGYLINVNNEEFKVTKISLN